MANEKNTTTVRIDAFRAEAEAPCLICGEGVPVFGNYYAPKVCEKCKAAIIKVREQDGK